MFGRISFFVNAGVRFIEEHAKLRAMARLWEEIGRDRYGVSDERQLRFRYGVQVNSLGLTESQPENNVYRICSRRWPSPSAGMCAPARSSCPRGTRRSGSRAPWDQQWSLRLQQILARETDLLEYPDIFEGSKVMEGLVTEMLGRPRGDVARGRARWRGRGGRLHEGGAGRSQRAAGERIESGEQTVVGMNSFEETERSPLQAATDGGILVVDLDVERERREAVASWREQRGEAAVAAALKHLAEAARDEGQSIMPASIEAARAGVTTGEWARTLRETFGAYRARRGSERPRPCPPAS